MPCHWIKLPGGGVAHVRMARQPRKRCSYCAELGAQLECDGCDKPLCRTCSVSPRDGLDFCARCFEPAWRHWLRLQPRSVGTMSQAVRRLAFRRWARAAADVFLRLVPIGAYAAAGKPTPHQLWIEAGENPEKYRALMIERGLLVKRDAPAHIDPMTPPPGEEE